MTTPQDASPFAGSQLQRCYLKGLSVELPNSPKVFLAQGELKMDLNLALNNTQLDTSVFEVVVRGTLTAKVGDQVVYLIEAEQAGIFALAGTPGEQLDKLLNVDCPTLVYPYMRSLMADTIARTGLPVFHLPEVNWAAMYQDAVRAQALAAAPVVGAIQ
jgi:preprotein translocase subunit SecB